ncbi:MAG: FGGY family carbohydrate kinase [Chitinophagaceae bacterium]
MLLLGLDIGTSSIKASVVDANTQQIIATAQYPETESEIIALEMGWEQNPEMWWQHVQMAILKVNAQQLYIPSDIKAIGIAYQMHGLVCVDKNQNVLRNSIIWCDSRAVEIGNNAFEKIGNSTCLLNLLNSPGNFTASKLMWVKENEPELFNKIDKVMLPGDFIAMKLTGECTTSISALSEGIFWDFRNNELSADVFDCYGFSKSLIPQLRRVFDEHGFLKSDVANYLSLAAGIPVTYKAGDQPNNALSLNILQPGEVAATAGTSGVIYGISDQLTFDKKSRVNTFAHVNYTAEEKRLGVLLCINGTGILNKWVKKITGNLLSYQEINVAASTINTGSNGLFMLPFGNGAERILENKIVQGHIHGIDFNVHTTAHLYRAAQEGIAFAFRYGLDIMRECGMHPKVIRAGKANMFLSDVFIESFVNSTGVPVELYNCDGSVGAALGAGIGVGIFKTEAEAFNNAKAA